MELLPPNSARDHGPHIPRVKAARPDHGSPILLSVKREGKPAERRSPVTRKEAKRRTRRRLVEAARRLLLTEGEQAISASAVARQAGVANATFYEHFADKRALLRELAEDLFATLRETLREPRRAAIEAPANESRLRRQFRAPLEVLAANPQLFRLALLVRHQPSSELGESSLRLAGSTRRDLVRELIDRGYPAGSEVERRRLEMIADVHIAATEALALGHVSGRYPDLDEIVDLLVLVTRGTRLVRELPQRLGVKGASSA
jgi:TetR/AcrR family transcriptional regulator, fatty acid biosynthesis regulator